MNSSTFSQIGTERVQPAVAQPTAAQVVREFVTAWFHATPVYLVYKAITTR
ncbi:hypothetical protein [Azospirillum sp. sgz302134]